MIGIVAIARRANAEKVQSIVTRHLNIDLGAVSRGLEDRHLPEARIATPPFVAQDRRTFRRHEDTTSIGDNQTDVQRSRMNQFNP